MNLTDINPDGRHCCQAVDNSVCQKLLQIRRWIQQNVKGRKYDKKRKGLSHSRGIIIFNTIYVCISDIDQCGQICADGDADPSCDHTDSQADVSMQLCTDEDENH